MRLLDGATAVVVGLRVVPGAGAMWDLSLDATHTFAVGDVQAVVHNCPQGGVGAVNKGQRGVDAANDILTAQGKMGIQTEVTFETPGAKTRVDLASLDPNTSTLTVAEAKNGMTAALTTNQSLACPYFVNNDVANIVPMGQNAANLGLQPGVSLANQGISQVDFRIFWFDI